MTQEKDVLADHMTAVEPRPILVQPERLPDFARDVEPLVRDGDVKILLVATTRLGQDWVAGTGFLLDPGVIITAHHVVAEKPYEAGPRGRALLRGVEIAEADLRAAGGAFELADVERLLGISRQAIAKRVEEGALIAVPGPGGRRRYPVAQFTRGGTLPGLREALSALRARNPWVQLNWLVNPDPHLGHKPPAKLLEAGEVEKVVAAARSQGHQGG